VVERSPDATRQLASRARRRVEAEDPEPDLDLDRQREVADAFLAASREGDFEALVAVLDPDVVLRADMGPAGIPQELHGAEAIARQAKFYSQLDLTMHRVLINGALGFITTLEGAPFSIGALTVRNGRIVELDFIADPERLAKLDLSVIGA
jgi:RNA polymerase sigma-70 factor (ECF subfamily)